MPSTTRGTVLSSRGTGGNRQGKKTLPSRELVFLDGKKTVKKKDVICWVATNAAEKDDEE